MKKAKTDKNFLHMPEYPGGLTAMKEFIMQHLKYPEEASKNNIFGHVSVKLTINHKGEVIQTEVLQGLGYGCDAEAKRVASLLKFHVDKNRGVKIRFFKTIHFNFHAPAQTIAPAPTTAPVQANNATSSIELNYSITPPKPVEKKPEKPVAVTFSYTVTRGS
jgi:TonB family protein